MAINVPFTFRAVDSPTQGEVLQDFIFVQDHLNMITGSEASPAQITANTNNYDAGANSWLRVNTDASRNITGIVARKIERTLWVLNVGAQDLVLQNQNGSSTAANRIISPTGADITLGANDSARLWYDTTTSRWRIISHTT